MENLKKRILVPIVGQGSITHIIRTGMLDMMSEFCRPVIAMLWKEEELVKELQQKGYEVTFFPPYKVSAEYAAVRYKINVWYLKHKLKTPSVNIQQQYLAQFRRNRQSFKLKKQLKDSYYSLRFKLQGSYIQELLQQEAILMHKEHVFAAYKEWLTLLNPSGLFTVTPFLHEVDLIARILKGKKTPVIASIHSFDNVTKRGWPAVIFDHYIVWNKYNKAELQRIYKDLQKNESITVAGAPQFDFHYNNQFAWSRDEWLKRLGLPADKKIILYGGGPASLFPQEPQYLKTLKDAFDEEKIPEDYVVLFRCHPLDKVERWKKYVGESSHIFYDSAPNGAEKLDYSNVLNDDIINLVSTLKHTDVHINTISTMSVDGSAFEKPQIGPYYDEVNPGKQNLLRQMYYQEHYVPIMNSKVVNLAHSKEEFIDLVKRVAESPATYTANCAKCVEEIITFSDGKSASRAVSAIKSFFER